MKALMLRLTAVSVLTVAAAMSSLAMASNTSEVIRLCRKTHDCVVSGNPAGHDILIFGPKGGVVVCPASGADCYVGERPIGRRLSAAAET